MLAQIKKIGLVAILAIAIIACSKNDDLDSDKADKAETDRKALLANIADNIVIPAYADFKLKLVAMKAKSDAFTANPTTTTLTEFRDAWVEAYTEWQKVELFDFGPAQNYAIRSYFNIYPVNVAGINTNIETGATTNLEVTAAFPTQGFPALDYLLNGVGETDATIITYYTGAEAAKRKAYVTKLTERMLSVFNAVNNEWNGAYLITFKTKTAIDAGSSTSLMVNSYVYHYERFIRSGKFGIPSGVMTAGIKYPEKVEAFYKKDLGLVLAKTAHQAAIDFFNGKYAKSAQEGYSLKDYLNSLDVKDPAMNSVLLSKVINDQFAVTTQKLNLLSANLSNEVVNNNQAMINVFNEMQKSIKLLKVDMTSAMSITITYTDNDGD